MWTKGEGTFHLELMTAKARVLDNNYWKAYARYASLSPDECKVVTIAEPRPKTREIFASKHGVPAEYVFNTWQDLHNATAESLLKTGKRLADAVIIAVQDNLHCEVAMAFAEQGYHMLCEKPMATSIEDCVRIADAVKKAGIIFGMGHGEPIFFLSV